MRRLYVEDATFVGRVAAALGAFCIYTSCGVARSRRSRRLIGRACGTAPVRRRGKSGSPAWVLTMTPSPAVLRTTEQNRVHNQFGRTAVANRGRRRSARLPTRFTHCAVTPRTRRRPAGPPDAPPPPGRWDVGGLRRSDYSRRDTRQSAKRRGSAPIGGGRESPLTHPAPRCRHDSSRTRGSSQPPPAAAAPARTRRFAAASNRSERPAHRRCIDRHRRAWEKLHRFRKRASPRAVPRSD